MVYKFVLLSDEVDNFFREIEIDSEATFFDFHEIILDSVGYAKNQITSFFLCSDNWDKKEEITLFEMDASSEFDSFVMDKTQLDEFITDEGQRLLYVFDNITERAFFIELKEIILSRRMDKPLCTVKKGKAPVQMLDIDDFAVNNVAKNDFDTDFYGDENFNEDELNEDGFGDVNFDDLGHEI
ncbi:MAG: hypothetical protein EOM76_00250 [Sphingobacteriia bacterium]|jgi:hypothetical protein|nr:hypothetical protein [Paludibacteraceae bacterium]NCA78619.1 hypothetical protein [Sphingobacteriia bacterium]